MLFANETGSKATCPLIYEARWMVHSNLLPSSWEGRALESPQEVAKRGVVVGSHILAVMLVTQVGVGTPTFWPGFSIPGLALFWDKEPFQRKGWAGPKLPIPFVL